MKQLAIQVSIISTVCTLFGFIFHYFAFPIWLGVLIGFVVQYAVYNVFIYGLDVFVALKNKELENERIKELSFQGMDVECPCEKKIKDFVPVKLNTDNTYKCRLCSRNIKVIVTAETALVTEPIQNVNAKDTELIAKAVNQVVKNETN